jgi:excisionase family DNA binding protein
MDSQRLYSIDEARERLGRIARATIYALMNNHKLESVKIGRRRFISETALQKFIAASTTSAALSRDRVRSIEPRQIPLKIAVKSWRD